MRDCSKDMSKNYETRCIDVNKISFGTTIWGPHGLRIAKELPFLVLSMFPVLERSCSYFEPSPAWAFAAPYTVLIASPAALGRDWIGQASLLFVFLFHSPCYFVYLPLNYPFKESPLRALSKSPQPTTHTHGQRISFLNQLSYQELQ